MPKIDQEKFLRAARGVFVKYGFRRATMGDLAEAAQMSRPALYLVFPSKEDVFTAVIKWVFAEVLDEIRQGIPLRATPLEKLTFAFEVWSVRPFEMVQASPDAGDLFESSLEFAAEFTSSATAEFESMIAQILRPLVGVKPEPEFSTDQIASMMTCAAKGFKSAAQDADQLRFLIYQLGKLTLGGMESGTPQARPE